MIVPIQPILLKIEYTVKKLEADTALLFKMNYETKHKAD
jgi:hypothetical protein